MKRISIFAVSFCALLGLVLSSCQASKVETAHRDWVYNSVVYEMNVRQQTPEGTFAAAEERLPFLKELGVDIVWLMPINTPSWSPSSASVRGPAPGFLSQNPGAPRGGAGRCSLE